MLVEVKVPQLSESVSEATLLAWHKKVGEPVKRDENLIDIETDKVVLELPAPADGVIAKIVKGDGGTVKAGEVIATIDTDGKGAAAAPAPAAKPAPAPTPAPKPAVAPQARAPLPQPPAPASVDQVLGGRPEQRVPMSRLRARIAERLVQSQSTAAILTTFNEVNMQPVMDLRNKYKDRFEKEHGVKLSFMSFFV